MDVRLPDGTIVQNVPDNITKAELVTRLKANGMAVPADWMADAPKPQASERAGSALMQIPRQAGLAARYGLEGAGQFADVFAAPFRLAINPILGAAGLPQARPLGAEASRAATAAGLPSPQTPDERVVGDATRTMAGGAGVVGASRAVANATQGAARAIAERLASGAGVQASAAAGAGGAGGSVREAGGDAMQQFLASMLGGVTAGGMTSGAANLAARGKAALTPQTVKTAGADQQIALVLERQGVDWTQVPERVRQSVRQEVADALQTGGQLNGDALRRLLAFRNTGTTPTVGMLTQNPAQITREMNLAKTGANSIDPTLQRLPAIQNQNAAQLLRNLDEAGAAGAPDAPAAGVRAMAGLRGEVARERGAIDQLYAAARDTQGRSLPLNGAAFTSRANQLMDEAMVGGALPGDVAATMNRIARGEMPFTVEIAEQLKTRIGNLQRGSSDGGSRMALGLVRQALDDTPLTASPQVNPGNLPAVPGTVPPSAQTVGREAIDAFNRARTANRTFMQRLEANPALAAVDDAMQAVRANPQLRSVEDVVGAAGFMQKYVLGKTATPGEVRTLVQIVGPDGAQALRQNVVRYLRDAATNSTDDITKFSNDAYRRALRDIGDDKLRAFFSPAELQRLRDVGEAAKYMQAQPVGSAVNNSNSGALVIGRGLDMLEQAAGYVPFGGRDIIKGVIQGRQQSQTLNPLLALTQPQFRQRPNPLFGVVLATPAQGREDDRSR